MPHAQQLVKYTANLVWQDQNGEVHQERHSAWTVQRSTTMAYRRAKSMIEAGQARAFTTHHTEETVI